MDIPVGPADSYAEPLHTVRPAQLAGLLRRKLWLIAVCGVAGAAGAFAYAKSLPPYYTAATAIAVGADKIAIPELQGVLRSDSASDPMPWVRTEVQALSSRDLLLGVVRRLKLHERPEFNPALRPPTPLQRVKDAVRALLPASPDGPAPAPDEAALDAVGKALTLFQDNRSLVVGVSFTSQDPALAAAVANAVVDDYVAARAKRRTAANQGANAAMLERIDQVRNDLAAIERQMRELRSTGQAVGLRAGSVGQQQLEELATAAARAGVERSQLEATWTRANALVRQGSSEALAGVLGSPTVSRLREQEAQASRRVAELSARYGADHPSSRAAAADLTSARRQVNDETARIVASLGTQLRVAREQEADLQKQLATARTASVGAENARAQLDQLQQEAATRRTLYQTLLERAQQTTAQPGEDALPDVRVLATAAPPIAPAGPNAKLAGGLGGFGGAVLGCLIALVRARGGGFSTPADLTAATGLPVAATLPRPTRRRGGLPARVRLAPGGPEAEAMRVLRARLRRVGRAGTPRAVAFAAVAEAQDAAQLAAAFARVAASGGERVLLVEGDLRAPKLGALLGAEGGGLAEALAGRADWRDAVAPDPAAGEAGGRLGVLLADRPAADAPALLGGMCLQNLLVDARAEHDLVVLSAPEAAASDALTLAHRADAAVLVVDARRASRAATQEAAAKLGAMSRSPLLAVVLLP